MEGILPLFLAFHDFPFVGTKKSNPSIFRRWNKNDENLVAQSYQYFFFNTRRLELFVKGPFWSSIFVWLKCHKSIWVMKLGWQPWRLWKLAFCSNFSWLKCYDRVNWLIKRQLIVSGINFVFFRRLKVKPLKRRSGTPLVRNATEQLRQREYLPLPFALLSFQTTLTTLCTFYWAVDSFMHDISHNLYLSLQLPNVYFPSKPCTCASKPTLFYFFPKLLASRYCQKALTFSHNHINFFLIIFRNWLWVNDRNIFFPFFCGYKTFILYI